MHLFTHSEVSRKPSSNQKDLFIFFLYKDSVKTSDAFRLQCYRCYHAVKQSDSYREDGAFGRKEKKKVKAVPPKNAPDVRLQALPKQPET